MITDPLFYLAAIPAVILMGLAKGGFAGVGTVALPLVALTISPVQAAGILLPILLLQDTVGVWSFRRNFDAAILKLMLPSAAVGIVLGYLLAAWVSVTVVLGVLGGISVLFAGYRLWGLARGKPPVPSHPPVIVGAALGVISGFTSQVAHAGQPPFQMWVMPKHLPPAVLVGTTAIYFGVVNWMKVPAYAALGQFTLPNLLTAAALAPLAIASTLAGVWLMGRIKPDRFYVAIYLLMIVVGLQLIWRALTG